MEKTFSSVNEDIYRHITKFFKKHKDLIIKHTSERLYVVWESVFEQYKDAIIPEIKRIVIENLDTVIECITFEDMSQISPKNIPSYGKMIAGFGLLMEELDERKKITITTPTEQMLFILDFNYHTPGIKKMHKDYRKTVVKILQCLQTVV
jgi:hypothetical protein